MLTDDEYFQTIRSTDGPRLPGSLGAFIGQVLGNHYQDAFLEPLPDELKKLVDALQQSEQRKGYP